MNTGRYIIVYVPTFTAYVKTFLCYKYEKLLSEDEG